MALKPGTCLGSYEIIAPIGAGGMGEVYRARDTKLDRDVAIKVLPAGFAQDRERLVRFEREAKLLASLNHSNIAHVYGFEAATLPDGSTAHFLAMELVPGEDLAERLKRGAIPIDEAIAIAKQIAEGLEEAHEHDIIHRDLKPANVKVTPDGKVKILDFGLAKALEGDSAATAANSQLSHSPTMSRHMTEAGMIMGTAAYMSPEQARGKAVDKRADIWSFGVVLFEMLAGKRLFEGETISDVLAAVLTRDPDWRSLPSTVTAPTRRLLARCLERDPRRRLRDIGEARLQLEDTVNGNTAEGPAPPSPARRSDRRLILVLGSLAALLAVLSVFLLISGRDESESPAAITRFSLVSDPAVIVTTELTVPFAVSPDGRTIVFTATRSNEPKGLWRRTLEDPEPRPIPGGQGGTQPAISPDGRWIAFLIGFHEVHKLPIEGGSAVRIGDIAGNSAALTWASNDELVVETFAEGAGLQRLAAGGGNPREAFPLDAASGEVRQRSPFVIPGTDRVVFLSQTKDNNQYGLMMASLTDGRREALGVAGARALGLFDGRLVYARMAGQIAALPIDVRTMRPTGPSMDLRDFAAVDFIGARVALSAGGTLVYQTGSTPTRIELLERGGALRTLGREAGIWGAPRFSPDGRTIVAAQKPSSVGGSEDLWTLDTGTGEATKLTRTGAAFAPAWRSSRDIAFVQGTKRGGELWSLPLDGSAPPGLWVDLKGEVSSVTVAPDGRSLVAVSWSLGRDNLLRVTLGGGEPTIEPLLAPGESLRWPDCPRISPDGRLVAFSAEPGEVFVRPLSGGGLLQASNGAGSCAAWGPDSRTLYYTVGDELRAVTLETSPKLAVESRRLEARLGRRVEALDVSPDGRVFVFVTSDTGADVYVVPGWAEGVRRK